MKPKTEPRTEVRMSSSLSAEEKKRDLFLRQKETLDLFLERGAISRAQHDKSLRDMADRMGYGSGGKGQKSRA